MNIYTKRGDDGFSDLLGGARAPKYDLRFCSLGDLDELNSVLGLVKCFVKNKDEKDVLEKAQEQIFALSAHIAALGSGMENERYMYLGGFETELEKRIDFLQSLSPEGFKFVLPGENEASAHADVARTVARRAERGIAALSREHQVSPAVSVFINRLSDYLYVLARSLENHVSKQ